MVEDVLNPEYWNGRLSTVTNLGKPLYQSVFRCAPDRWQEIETKHKQILTRHLGPRTSVLDIGCGYGRLLTLTPTEWQGNYLGVDICTAFIDMARETHPGRVFMYAEADKLQLHGCYDLAIMVSVRPMLIRNAGVEYWQRVEERVRMYATNLLYLEYDPLDDGSLE